MSATCSSYTVLKLCYQVQSLVQFRSHIQSNSSKKKRLQLFSQNSSATRKSELLFQDIFGRSYRNRWKFWFVRWKIFPPSPHAIESVQNCDAEQKSVCKANSLQFLNSNKNQFFASWVGRALPGLCYVIGSGTSKPGTNCAWPSRTAPSLIVS